MCEKCDAPDMHPDETQLEKESAVFDAWDKCSLAAANHDMEVSRLETDEDPSGQRWIVWARKKNGDLSRGQYGAIGMTPQEALENLTSILKGMPQ